MRPSPTASTRATRPSSVDGEPRHIVGYLGDFLFPRDRVHSPVRSLSGGERNRLMLARLFAKPANVLVLDEPTNDLDIETLELLEELLGTFQGHGAARQPRPPFLDNIVTSILVVEAGGPRDGACRRVGDYLRQVEAPARPRPATRSSGRSATGPGCPAAAGAETGLTAPTVRRTLGFREQRELEQLPDRIDALEREQAALRAEMESADFYKAGADRIRLVMSRLDEVTGELDDALARWIELEERR
jgi:ABC transport system ATP-binding/permease protein